MSNLFDISVFKDTSQKYVSLGKVPSKIVEFINKNTPANFNKLKPNNEIIFWKDRLKHIEVHKKDFISDNEFYNCVEQLPKIIASPDYLSVHPKDNSISFIKDYSSHISVAVKISMSGALSFRTMYPLMDAQLSNYIKNGRAWKWNKTLDINDE